MTNQPAEDVNKRIGQFVKLRDLKKEITDRHKAELAPINEAMDGLQAVLAQVMSANNVDSLATAAGTAYQSSKDSVSCSDMAAFWTFVSTQGMWDMLDKKPNVTAVREYIDQHGSPPPGCSWSSVVTVNVRRK